MRAGQFGRGAAVEIDVDTLEQRRIAVTAANSDTVCAITLGSAWTHARFKA